MCVCLIGLIFISMSLVAKDTKDTKITITGDSVSIKQAFEQIEAQSQFTIAYNQTQFNAKRKLREVIKNASIEIALTFILKNTGFTYKMNGFHVIIKPENKIPQSPKKGKKLTQTIRGLVRDATSEQPLYFATVVLLGTDPLKGCSTDSLGRFRFDNIPMGRYDMQVSVLGYEPTIVKEVLVLSAKESYNEVALKEQITNLDEVVVRPQVDKEKPLNAMTLAGGRMFSVEEANRFAGGFDDPARLVSSFAGVAGNVGINNLSIHGNSPQSIQWKLEGIEIPNPSHFADINGLGGGLQTALSSLVMGNSDFLNGAFPAEYNNALSGVFDMSMRNGNNQNYEHAFQIGLLGVDLASEGPLSKKNGSSYLINYRNSFSDLVMDGSNLRFQDLVFKLNFPTRKAGTFSIWGLGLIDGDNVEVEDESEWESYGDRVDVKTDLMKMATGIGHKFFINKSAYLKTSLAFTYADTKQDAKMTENKETYNQVMDIVSKDWSMVFNSYLNKKISARHTNRTGVTFTGLFYDLDFKVSPTFVPVVPMEQSVKGDGSSSMVSVFSNSLIDITERFSTNIGLTAQYFALNNHWSIEPRVSFKYKVAPRHTLSLAYGLHSRREKLDYYYIKTPETGDQLVNKDLDFTKANHFVLSYAWGITDNIHLRVEPYYQCLSDVPVELGTSFSTINYNEYYLEKVLVNKGKGRNYGIDITLERYLNKGYYWLLTGSVFNSKYRGGDGVWRNTKYNRKYIINALVGKEWMCGKQKQNTFSANIRFSYQGGDYYTPIDVEASEEQHDIVLNERKAFSVQFSPVLTSDISVGYKINKKKVSHGFSLQILNLGMNTGQHGYFYNEKINEIEKVDFGGFIPNISYKLEF